MMRKNNFYTDLPWDSRLFGYRVARLDVVDNGKNLRAILQELKDKKYRLVYWFVDPKHRAANKEAKNCKGILIDEKITYIVTTARILKKPFDSTSVSLYKKKNTTPKLVSLVLQSGAYSRFARDAHFTHGEYKKNVYYMAKEVAAS